MYILHFFFIIMFQFIMTQLYATRVRVAHVAKVLYYYNIVNSIEVANQRDMDAPVVTPPRTGPSSVACTLLACS